jgi:hypothetical protein
MEFTQKMELTRVPSFKMILFLKGVRPPFDIHNALQQIISEHRTDKCREILMYSHVSECDYRRGFDWWLDLFHTLLQHVTTLYSSLSHTHTHTHKCPQSRHHCPCLVAAFNGRRPPSSRFLKCPRPQLPASAINSSQRLNPRFLWPTATADWSWL